MLCLLLYIALGLYFIYNSGALIGVLIIVIGETNSFIMAALIYGYGVLIENSDKTLQLQRISTELQLSDHKDYPRFEEYAQTIVDATK